MLLLFSSLCFCIFFTISAQKICFPQKQKTVEAVQVLTHTHDDISKYMFCYHSNLCSFHAHTMNSSLKVYVVRQNRFCLMQQPHFKSLFCLNIILFWERILCLEGGKIEQELSKHKKLPSASVVLGRINGS